MLTPFQRELRKSYIGGSDVSTLFLLNEYNTPYRLWLEKTGQVEREEIDPIKDSQLWYGNAMENLIIDRYMLETGKTVITGPVATETKYSPLSPYLICHLDGIVKDEKKLLEVKCARYNPSKWGSGSSEIPVQYQVQCQAQLACMPEYESVDLVVFFWQAQSINIYTIHRNEEMIQSIINTVNRFWNNHVIANVAPELFTADDVKLCYPVDNSQFLEASPIEMDSYIKLSNVRRDLKIAKENDEKYKNDLIVMMGANTGIKHNGDLLCTYKADKNGKRSFRFYGEES